MGNGEEHCNFQVRCQDLHFVVLASLLSWQVCVRFVGRPLSKAPQEDCHRCLLVLAPRSCSGQSSTSKEHHLCAIEVPWGRRTLSLKLSVVVEPTLMI